MQRSITIKRGFISPYFVTDKEQQICELDRPYVLITKVRLWKVDAILDVLEKTAKQSRPLFIIADDVEGELLSVLIMNKLRGTLKVCAIKKPGFGETLDETLEKALHLTGATLTEEYYAEQVAAFEELGFADRVVVTKDSTQIIIYDEEERAKHAISISDNPVFVPGVGGMGNMDY